MRGARYTSALLVLLADRTAHSMISYWHHYVVCMSVCPSVRLSVTLHIVAKRYILQRKYLNKCLGHVSYEHDFATFKPLTEHYLFKLPTS